MGETSLQNSELKRMPKGACTFNKHLNKFIYVSKLISQTLWLKITTAFYFSWFSCGLEFGKHLVWEAVVHVSQGGTAGGRARDGGWGPVGTQHGVCSCKYRCHQRSEETRIIVFSGMELQAVDSVMTGAGNLVGVLCKSWATSQPQVSDFLEGRKNKYFIKKKSHVLDQ